MIKKGLMLLPILLTSLMACQSDNKSSKVKLSYGKTYDESATLLSVKELESRINNEESFLLAMSPGNEEDVTCSCWRTFSSIIDDYVKNNDRIVYKCDVYNAKKYGVEPPINQDPGFAIFENGKLKKQYVYTVKNTPTYFTNKDAFKEFVDDISIEPNMIYVDDEKYQEIIAKDEQSIVSIVRKGCSDCGYVLPNVFDPFFKENKIDNKLYLLDIEELDHYHTSSEEEKTAYQEYKDSIKLSEKNNALYGYGNGVVPTTFVYKDGEAIDGNVFFNDEVEFKDEKYYISNSYYTSERVKNLKYTDTVLMGKELKEEEIAKYNDFIYLPSSSASKYHTPILNEFLNYYYK